jgi:hypothetical protein
MNFVSRTILLFLAIQILNLSVNSIDFKPIATSDFTEFNDINTIAEYVSEIVLGHVNAFPEFEQKTQKQSQLQKHFSIKIINDVAENEVRSFPPTSIPYSISLKGAYLYKYFNEINPPPPKV